ncbi:unnamed protein product [Ectocarpus sp. CCAP 1310/34]|nr:unnamed protein product [Ectocarpus sp. CCAP 1310/34]CAB1104034.1 unnamed protein product [Ectocarpus sp. CCAP 1310/34]CAB1104318.1 unnamed protein product [Ectocarpus sp. CCAP 1310/34]CAB1104923.1 unnamed protein product [Ectocarpus sp. CCAP 1310/34]CAB1117599.1 unnamed protein product [Ectocarpus sp. CCAP 1310/34]
MEDYLLIRRDVNPAFDGLEPGQPAGQLKSGQQYNDQLSALLDELWIVRCKNLGKPKDVVDLDEERDYLPARSSQSSPATVKEEDGEPELPCGGGLEGEGADGTQEGAAGEPAPGETSPAEVEDTKDGSSEAGGGGAVGAGSGAVEAGSGGEAGTGSDDSLGPEPEEGSPDYPRWLARQGAINAKQAASDDAVSSSGDGNLGYGPRPANWTHPLTLTFCFFGRPAGEHEDTELNTCAASSGPPSRGKKRKGGKGKAKGPASEGGGSGEGSSGEGSLTENPLHAGAVRQFVGAGEAQSRAKVKKATQEVELRQSRDAARAQFLRQNTEQLEVAKEMRDAVKRVADNTTAQRALQEEEACRKRKKQAIEDLEGDLQYCESHEAKAIKLKIRAMRKMPVGQFTADFVSGGIDDLAGPSAPEVTSDVPALPGFSLNSETPGPEGGGATAQHPQG